MFKNAMIIVFLLALFPMQVNAATSKVIVEGSAGGFHYKMIKEDRTIFWEIGSEKHEKTFKQNSENKGYVESFREAVSEAEVHRFTLVASAGYFVFVGIIAWILYKKRRNIFWQLRLFIAFLACGALYFAVTNYIEMQAALQDAGYYYGVLLVE